MRPLPSPPVQNEDSKSAGVGEIYMENYHLLGKLGLPGRSESDLGASVAELGGAVSSEYMSLLQQSVRNSRQALMLKTKRWKWLSIAATVLFALCLVAVIILAVTGRSDESGTEESTRDPPERLPIVISAERPNTLGLKPTITLKDCIGNTLRRSFPDLDYALLGYNALKGYPLAVGHDPGFTLPIFQADYSEKLITADCRYNVPKGVVLLSDVACVTSFSSEVVQTSYQLSRSLETSADVNGGGWGASFSASVGYKEAASRMSTGKSVFVLSKATCNYYQMKLLEDDAPPFHPVFLKWVKKLSRAQSQATDPQTGKLRDTPTEEQVYLEFFEKYGTHFLTEAKFGASYTYEHQMKTSDFKRSLEKGVNVEAAASYSGSFSAGAEMKMDSSVSQSASEFRKQVTTRTVTVGAAPPADGNAMTWASVVQENPVPVSYTLHSFEDLFTETYMGRPSMQQHNIDYRKIRRAIKHYKQKYCYSLKDKGLVDSCAELSPGLMMPGTEIFGRPEAVIVSSMDKCVDECNKRASCVAVDFCVHCKSTDSPYNTCHLYKEGDATHAYKNDKFEAMVILDELNEQMVFRKTAVSGVERSITNARTITTEKDCFAECLEDLHCAAFTYTDHPYKQKCTLYSDKSLTLFEESDTTTHFISHRVKSADDIYPTIPGRAPTPRPARAIGR